MLLIRPSYHSLSSSESESNHNSRQETPERFTHTQPETEPPSHQQRVRWQGSGIVRPETALVAITSSPLYKIALMTVGFFVTLLLAVRLPSELISSVPFKENLELSGVLIDQYYDALAARFPSQSEDTKFSLKVALEQVLNVKEPREPPSMIILIPASMSHSFPICFAQVFGRILNRAYNPNSPASVKMISAADLQTADTTTIHRDLENYFENGKAVIVLDIQKLRSEEHLTVFHTFSDNTHAPVKRALYLYLVHIPDDYKASPSISSNAKHGNDILEKAWKNVLDWDKIHPLLARVGSWGTVLLNEGDSCEPGWGDM